MEGLRVIQWEIDPGYKKSLWHILKKPYNFRTWCGRTVERARAVDMGHMDYIMGQKCRQCRKALGYSDKSVNPDP